VNWEHDGRDTDVLQYAQRNSERIAKAIEENLELDADIVKGLACGV